MIAAKQGRYLEREIVTLPARWVVVRLGFFPALVVMVKVVFPTFVRLVVLVFPFLPILMVVFVAMIPPTCKMIPPNT